MHDLPDDPQENAFELTPEAEELLLACSRFWLADVLGGSTRSDDLEPTA